MTPDLSAVEEVVAVGRRKIEDRAILSWLTAAGVALGIGSTVAIAHHYDASHPEAHHVSAMDVAQTVQASRPRLGR